MGSIFRYLQRLTESDVVVCRLSHPVREAGQGNAVVPQALGFNYAFLVFKESVYVLVQRCGSQVFLEYVSLKVGYHFPYLLGRFSLLAQLLEFISDFQSLFSVSSLIFNPCGPVDTLAVLVLPASVVKS